MLFVLIICCPVCVLIRTVNHERMLETKAKTKLAKMEARRQIRYMWSSDAMKNLSVVLIGVVEKTLADNGSQLTAETAQKYHEFLNSEDGSIELNQYMVWIKILCAKSANENVFGVLDRIISVYRTLLAGYHSGLVKNDVDQLLQTMQEYPCCDLENLLPQMQLAINAIDKIVCDVAEFGH